MYKSIWNSKHPFLHHHFSLDHRHNICLFYQKCTFTFVWLENIRKHNIVLIKDDWITQIHNHNHTFHLFLFSFLYQQTQFQFQMLLFQFFFFNYFYRSNIWTDEVISFVFRISILFFHLIWNVYYFISSVFVCIAHFSNWTNAWICC